MYVRPVEVRQSYFAKRTLCQINCVHQLRVQDGGRKKSSRKIIALVLKFDGNFKKLGGKDSHGFLVYWHDISNEFSYRDSARHESHFDFTSLSLSISLPYFSFSP